MPIGHYVGLGMAAFAAALACSASAAVAQDKKPYRIYLSNNYVGNDWRQQMLRSANIAASKPPLAGRVDLKVEVVETAIQAQINSLNNIIREKPDAILIDAGSGEALNPVVQKACAAGILVISFDQIVSADCAYKLESDWNRAPVVEAEWLVNKLGGKGSILVDRGLAGAPISAQLENGFENVIKDYPDIKIVGYFNGDYALGPEQAGVASLLAAHPQVDAIFVQGYGAGAIKALQDAGRPIVPVTGSPFNLTTTTCVETKGAQCILAPNPAYLSAEALKLAVAVLDGAKPPEKHILLHDAFLTTDPQPSKRFPDAKMDKIEVGKTAFPDLAPGLVLPVSPDWLQISPAEAAGSSN
jgi:ribose transport system substrate-binding protein